MSFEQDPFQKAARAGTRPLTAVNARLARHGSQLRARHHDLTAVPAAHAGTGSRHPASSTPHGAAAIHRSRVHLAARAGVQKIEVASIQSYDAASNTALVRILGAQANVLGPLPLGEGLSPLLAVPGATCLVVLLDEANPADAAIVAIYNAAPQPWSQAGTATLALSGYQLAQAVSFATAFSASVPAVTATSRDSDFVASVSAQTLGGFVLTLTRREGASQAQGGAINVTVAAGASSGSASLLFPSAFAVARSVVATSTAAGWTASVSGVLAGGCVVGVSSASVGPATITVYWEARGDPLVSALVAVDWQAVGT